MTSGYDASGQRISKTVNGVTTEFYYDDRGVLVLSSSSDGTELRFYADAEGNNDSFTYNNEQFYYVRNAQNDVIGITDSTGAFVARYTYDEWGVITSITDGNGVDVSTNPNHIANINPLRYRSYFYDAETGFYWLNTRYYDPEIGRFINADSYASTGQGVLGHNMFSYCLNNYINFLDTNGTYTFGISFALNVSYLFGFTIGIGWYIDDSGNSKILWFYSCPGTDAVTLGTPNLGFEIGIQGTSANSVNDLYGIATSLGGSAGFAGVDFISFSDASDLKAVIEGIQINFGVSAAPYEVHISETITSPFNEDVNDDNSQNSVQNAPIADLMVLLEEYYINDPNHAFVL